MEVPVSKCKLVLKTYICEGWDMEAVGGVVQGEKVIEMPFDGSNPTKERQAWILHTDFYCSLKAEIPLRFDLCLCLLIISVLLQPKQIFFLRWYSMQWRL